MIKNNIAKYRKYLGLTQTDLGEAIGFNKNYISMVENYTRRPSCEMMEKLCIYFDVPLAAMFYIDKE